MMFPLRRVQGATLNLATARECHGVTIATRSRSVNRPGPVSFESFFLFLQEQSDSINLFIHPPPMQFRPGAREKHARARAAARASLTCPRLIPARFSRKHRTCEAAAHRNNLLIWLSTKEYMFLN